MDRLKVREHPGMFRDPISHAIIVDDPSGRKNYQMHRETILRSRQDVNTVMEEINQLKIDIEEIKTSINNNELNSVRNDVSEIKMLLQELLQNK
jgi:hypothetical protein